VRQEADISSFLAMILETVPRQVCTHQEPQLVAIDHGPPPAATVLILESIPLFGPNQA
jgi:hypothetical protein